MSPADSTNVDLLVRNASWVVTLAGEDIRGGWVACQDGTVVATGRGGTEPTAIHVLDARGGIVTPGLVNAHHHLFQNLTRAHAPSSTHTLVEWLQLQRPMWAHLDQEAAYLSAWVGLADLALAGCTTTADNIYLHPRPGLVAATLRAAHEVGLRLDPCRGFIDALALPVEGAEELDVALADAGQLLEKWHDPSASSRCRVSLGPTSLEATRSAALREAAELARTHATRLHVHLFEEAVETDRSIRLHGLPPVELLVDSGWSGRAWIAHGNHLTPTGARALAQAQIDVAHCPSSNLFLGGPAAPITMLAEQGCILGLGTDGAASSGTSQLWLEARTAMLLAREHQGPTALGARQALVMATQGSAACLGRAGEIGALAPGLQADLAVWEASGTAYAGAVTDPVETWLRCGPPRARHTVVGGQVIVRDGELVAGGLDEVLTQHRRHALAWQSPTGPLASHTKGHAHAGRS